MARVNRYINPSSPTASNSNDGTDWSGNAWLDFGPLNTINSVDCWVEPGCTIFSTPSATIQLNNITQVTIRQRTAGTKPVVTWYENIRGAVTWFAVSTDDFTTTATGPSTNIWRCTPSDEPLFVAFNSLNAVIDAYNATTVWHGRAEHVRVRYLDSNGTVIPGNVPNRIGQYVTSNNPYLVVYSPGGRNPDDYYSGGIFVAYGPAVKMTSCSAFEWHDLRFQNCGVGLRWGGTQATVSANLVQSCEFYNCGNGHHVAWGTNANGQGMVGTRNCLFQYIQRHSQYITGWPQDSYCSSSSFEFTGLHGGVACRIEGTHSSAGQPVRIYGNTFRQFQNNIYFTGEDGGAFYAESSTQFTEFYQNQCYDGKAAYRNNSGMTGHHAYMNLFSSVDIAFSISDSDAHNSASMTFTNNTIYSTFRAHGTASANLSGTQPDYAICVNQFGKGTVRFFNNIVTNLGGDSSAYGMAMEPGPSSATAVGVEQNNIMSGVAAIKAVCSAGGIRAQAAHASSTLTDAGLAAGRSGLLTGTGAKAVGWGASITGFTDQRDVYGRFPYGGIPAGCTFYIPNGRPTRTRL